MSWPNWLPIVPLYAIRWLDKAHKASGWPRSRHWWKTTELAPSATREHAQCPDLLSLMSRSHLFVDRQAIALFLIAPTIAVSMAPPAPPAIACETMPLTLRLPDCAAATTDGNNNVTIWPSTPPPTKPAITLPIVPRSKVGDDLPAPTPPSAPAMRLIRTCSMWIPLPVTNTIDLA